MRYKLDLNDTIRDAKKSIEKGIPVVYIYVTAYGYTIDKTLPSNVEKFQYYLQVTKDSVVVCAPKCGIPF